MNYPQYAQQPQQMTVLEYKKMKTAERLFAIKQELHTAMNPYALNKCLRETIELVEWLVVGNVSDAQPNQIPGIPAATLDDPTKTKVEFYAGPGVGRTTAPIAPQYVQAPQYVPPPQFAPAPAPAPAPIALPTPPWEAPANAGPHRVAPSKPITNGDTQFIQGPPPGSPGAVGGQTVEFYGGPGDNGNGQRVEFYPSPEASPQPPAPASNAPAGVINPFPIPTLPTEAGNPVPPLPGVPMTLEQARIALPIPLAE